MATGVLKTDYIETGTVTASVTIGDGHIRAYRTGKVVVVKLYVKYGSSVAANTNISELPWTPNDLQFATIWNASAGTPVLAQVNTNKTLQLRTAVSSNNWIEGQIVYLTND